jgi:DNA primase
MPLYSERFINQVRQATDIVEVVGQFVALKKKGKQFVGLCPFHDDHHPSMGVVPDKQIFKCFSCGEGGGVFQFLMKLQKLNFPETVRQLADRAGIPIPVEPSMAGADYAVSPETLVKLTTFAARWFRDQLIADVGREALAYARGRKFTEESIRRFGLGFAPESWNAFRNAAAAGGFSERQMLAAGLVIAREDGSSYDRFRNRLIFPILETTGKVIGFGGRALAADQPAKYLNSPETVLFDKSANLYALNWARDSIVKTERVVVVEGYLDALIPIQEGVANVVATLGTALTERHVRMLSRLAREVVLVFDSDAAGAAATGRAIELFLSQRLNVRVAQVPNLVGEIQVKDPCDFVLAAGGAAFGQLLDAAPDALDYAWTVRRDRYQSATTLSEKREILEDFLRLVASSAAYGSIDALRQGLLIGRLVELVRMPAADLTGIMRRLARRAGPMSGTPVDVNAANRGVVDPVQGDRAQRWLLGAILNQPDLADLAREKIDPEMFSAGPMRAIAQIVWRLAGEGQLELSSLLADEQAQEWSSLLTDLQIEGEKRGHFDRNAADAMTDMLRRWDAQNVIPAANNDEDAQLRQAARRAPTDKRRLPKI